MAHPHPLLIALARGLPLREPEDPRALVTSAVEHRMAGLLRSRVLSGELLLDRATRDELLVQELANRAQQAPIRRALEEITARAASIGVQLATFKGPTAADRWYDRDGERAFSDLDVLVRPADLPRVGELASLIEPGYELGKSFQLLVDRRELPSVNLILNGATIDLHFEAMKFAVPSRSRELLWSRTKPYGLPAGGETRVFDAETALVHLLLHLNTDRFRYLLGYVDIGHLLTREAELDWDFVFELIRFEGLDVPLTLTLEAVARVLDLQLPAHAPPNGWRASVWRRVWSPDVRLQGRDGAMGFRNRQRHRVLPLLVRGRSREGLIRWLRWIVPPAELMDYRFPGTTGPRWKRNIEARLKRFVGRRRASARRLDVEPLGPSSGTNPTAVTRGKNRSSSSG